MFSGFSQNYLEYYYAINNAKVLTADSNYSEAFKTYIETFKKYNAFTYDYIDAYSCAVNIKKFHAAKKYIYKAVKSGYDPKYIYDTTDVFDGLQPQCKEIKYNKNKLQRLHKKYFQSIDIDYSIELIKLLGTDQGLRMSKFEISEDSLIQKVYLNDSVFRNKYLNLYYKSMTILDSTDYHTLYSYIKNKGFNMRTLLGDAFVGGSVVLAHALHFCNSYNNCDSIINYLKGQLIKGEFEPIMFARIYDKYCLARYDYSYYGILFTGDDIILYEPNNIDKRRKEIGLVTIEQ